MALLTITTTTLLSFPERPSLSLSLSINYISKRCSVSRKSVTRLVKKNAVFHARAKQVQSLDFALDQADQLKMVEEVKNRLEREHKDLPLGKNGRDDDELLLWFLKDRKFNVDAAVGKLVKALTWRKSFGVDNLTEESIMSIASTGKAYLHMHPDVEGRPVVVVVASKHFPSHDLLESEQLCIYLIEKALSQLRPGDERILGIFDLRGFTSKNGDLQFVRFLVDVFFNYYPKRLAQVLFVDAPFIFQPGWNIVKPWLKSYASLVRFCSADTVREEYFNLDTIPPDFQAKKP